MTLTDSILMLFIAALLAFAIYDELILPRRHGDTLLALPLLRRSRVDATIFVGLLVILIYNNVTNNGTSLTTWLLSALALLAIYLFWIRIPKIIFKSQGFFFSSVWIEYNRIKEMNLSEDGVLVMQLEQRRLLIRVKNIDDLERYINYLLKFNKLQKSLHPQCILNKHNYSLCYICDREIAQDFNVIFTYKSKC
jgi:uncharacterized membrane protein YobD (UPF0266 family)